MTGTPRKDEAGARGGFAAALRFLRRERPPHQYPEDAVRALYEERPHLLLDRFPALRGRLPWMPLGDFPTAVTELPHPAPDSGGRLLAKRDDRSSPLYGGNKVRKLEHLLADATLAGARTLVTIGGIGSNQALATSLHGRAHGFDVVLSLMDQPVTDGVRATLLALAQAGAEVRHTSGTADAVWSARQTLAELRRAGRRPYWITVGATTRLGTVGYVTAALELAEQVQAGLLPEPDRIFVAAGTCGTAAGLVAGLKLTELRSRVVGVRVGGALFANAVVIRAIARATLRYLRSLDPTFPDVAVRLDDFDVVTGYLGAGYGAATPEAHATVEWAAPALRVETTYTAKALAACLDYCRGAGARETVLFWNTYNSAPVAAAPGPETLPDTLRALFR
jgi:D-cysteine desulfhydrase